MTAQGLLKSIRSWAAFFIVSLILSGVTAFPVETLLGWICGWFPWKNTALYSWLLTCYNGIAYTNEHFPFIAYGLDWLAFAHIVIGISRLSAYALISNSINSSISRWIPFLPRLSLPLNSNAVKKVAVNAKLIMNEPVGK